MSLALTGILLPAGDVLGQTLVHVAGQTAGEIATAVVVTGGGEAAVGAAGTGLKHAAGQLFRRLQADHARRRAEQLTEIFERELLGVTSRRTCSRCGTRGIGPVPRSDRRRSGLALLVAANA